MVWTREKERRARDHETSTQRDSMRGKAERKTMDKIYGHHQEVHDIRANGMEVKDVWRGKWHRAIQQATR